MAFAVNIKWLLKHLIESECDDLENFVHTIKSGLESESDRFSQTIDERLQGLDEQKKAEILDWYADEAFGLLDRYPKILWQSVFISFYAFFEHEMNNICKQLRNRGATKIPKSGAKSPGPSLSAEPCLEQFSIDIRGSSKERKRLVAYMGIRNLIVHHRGQLRKKDKESARVRSFVKRQKTVSLNHHEEILISPDFCLEILATVRTHLVGVLEAIADGLMKEKPFSADDLPFKKKKGKKT